MSKKYLLWILLSCCCIPALQTQTKAERLDSIFTALYNAGQITQSIKLFLFITKKQILTFLLCFWLIVGGAQELPHNTVERLARQLIAAINTGDTVQQKAFIMTNFSKSALQDTTWQSDLVYLYKNTGGLVVATASPLNDTTGVQLILHSKQGNRWLKLQTRLSRDEPYKLEGYGIGLGQDPAVMKAYTWPKSTNDEVRNIQEIARQAAHATQLGQFSGVVLIAKHQHVLFNKAYGLADQTFRVPNDTGTRFNIGSMNKMFTAVAIGQLVQAGKLNFNDTLSKILPDYPNQGIAKRVTIAQLLSHTAGMGDYLNEESYTHRRKFKTLSSYLPLFVNDTLEFKPGTKWSYSNAGFLVLGLVIERLSGEDYFDYIRKHIYAPAGMGHTDSYETSEVIPDVAVGYKWPGGFDPFRLHPRQMNWDDLGIRGTSAGGGYATAADLFRFSKALQDHKLLNKEITETLLDGKVKTGRAAGAQVQYDGYGFFDTVTGNMHIAGHGGGMRGGNTDLKIFRDGTYTIIVLSNYDSPAAAGLSQQIAVFLLDRQ
jgi:D-alanyl-D-alanine carboxypeptidase